MRDYEELVKMLRACGDSNNSCGNCPIRENDGSCPHGEWEFAAENYMLQAADAIEELIMQQRGNEEAVKVMQMEIDRLLASRTTKREVESKWISVEERLPEDKETCLIWYEYYHYSLERVLPEYGIGFYLSMYDMWYGDPSTGKDVKVLYWMPLPKPPKEEKE